MTNKILMMSQQKMLTSKLHMALLTLVLMAQISLTTDLV